MTMFTAWQPKRRLINVQEVGRLEEIARRWNAGQRTQGQTTATNNTVQHKA